MFHGVEAEAVNTHLQPLLHADHYGLEGFGVLTAGGGAVVEVHERAGAEFGVVVIDFAAGHHYGLHLVGVVVGIEGMRHAELHLVAVGVEAPFGLAGPNVGVGGAHEAAPGALVIDGEGVFVRTCVGELGVSAVAPVEVTGGIAVGAAGGDGCRGFGDRHLGCGGIGPVEVDLIAMLALSAYRDRVPFVLVISVVRRNLGYPACCHIGCRIFGEREVVPVWAGLAVVLNVEEPFALVAGMVHHVVHVDTDVVLVSLLDEVLEVFFRAVALVHGLVVGDVVAVIALCRLDGGEPEGGDSEGIEVVETLGEAAQVAVAVAVGILEAEYVHLIGETGTLVCRCDGGTVSAANVVVGLAVGLMGPGSAGLKYIC